MQGFFDFDESFDSCITATLTSLFLSNTTPSSVSLLSITLALNCRTLNVLSSLICSADGAGVGDGEGGGGVGFWVFEAEQWSQVQSSFLRYCAAFKSPEHLACTHPVHLVHREPTPRLVTSRPHNGQGYLAVGPGLGCMLPAIRRSRSCVRTGRRRSGFVVGLRISSAASN